MKKISLISTYCLISLFLLNLIAIKNISAAEGSSAKNSGGSNINDEIYVEILSKMIYYDHFYRKKYKLENTNPKTNATSEGVANAYKYANALKKERKTLLNKYGLSERDFENYSDKINQNSSMPEGSKRQKKLLERAAQKSRTLDK
ncbi:MAG: hypothetical protein NT145_00685 [Elusimicrobia bacterium]|nr:hypothetical protein [Elusimicrobiota bacterium]